MIVDVIIEMPKYCKYKYKYKDGKFLKKRRLLKCGGKCQYDYGFVENTIAPDNAPLDIIVIGNTPRKLVHCRVKIIGAITRYDRDDKIVAVSLKSRITSIKQLAPKKLQTIVDAWTGNWPGQTPLKEVIDRKDAEHLVKKYLKKK